MQCQAFEPFGSIRCNRNFRRKEVASNAERFSKEDSQAHEQRQALKPKLL
jgi:hypothetical protein